MDKHSQHPCLEISDLEAYLRANATDPSIESHLRDCASCRNMATELDANNALMREIVSAGVWSEAFRAINEPSNARTFSIPGLQELVRLHQGGQGIVFRGHHIATRRTVAVKVLLHGKWATSKQRARFDRETELVASLKHPNIVRIFDRGVTEDGLDYFIMEYVEGQPLDTYVSAHLAEKNSQSGDSPSTRDPLPIARLMSGICDAVNFAHQRGVIHRDLKPSNILVDANGQPHILDFGLAKQLQEPSAREDQAVTTTGEFMGTLLYASPEQLSSDSTDTDIRTDVYALGVIMYELLTGQLPHKDPNSTAALIESITRIEPDAPSRVSARSSTSSDRRVSSSQKELDAIVLKSLAKNPEHRYQSARELKDDIENFINGGPVSARAGSTWYVIRKIAKRHRLKVTVSVLFLAMIVGFGVTVSIMYARTLRQTERVRAMKEFLEDMLASAEPAVAGRDVTVRDALDEAARWVKTSLVDQPDLEASVRLTIGNTYRSIGVLEEAEVHLRESLRIRLRLNGDEHLDVSQCLTALALLESAKGALATAERYARNALSMRERLVGPNDLLVGRSLNNLGNILNKGGRSEEALEMMNRCLDIQRQVHGERHPDVAMMLYKIAELELQRSNSRRALKLHRDALEIRRIALTNRHPDLAKSLLATGTMLTQIDEYAEAEKLLREALAIRQETLAENHWRVAEAMSLLGECLVAQKSFDEGSQLLNESAGILQNALAECDPLNIRTYSSLLSLAESRQQTELALEYKSLIERCASESSGVE